MSTAAQRGRHLLALASVAWVVGCVTLNAAGGAIVSAADTSPVNLAERAHASAFESYGDMTPDLANDGKPETRWSGIPGHNTGGWYELDWDQPVRLGEVVIHQYDRFVKELDVQVWDDTTGTWVTLQHFGLPDQRLPRVVDCRFAPRITRRLRLANITNGPSFTEVEAFEQPFARPPAVNLASDVNGHFIGIVSDAWGSAPVAGAEVSLSGQAKSGLWETTATSDDHGLFFAPMPLGLVGPLTVRTRVLTPGAANETARKLDAAAFRYGLTPLSSDARRTSLSGRWRFAVDPPADFWKPGFGDSRWGEISVPVHFEMAGFHSPDGTGGYRKRFKVPGGRGRLKLRFDGVYSGAEVWVNGQRLAYHEGGALPFEVDITEAAKPGENVLAVRVTEHTPVSDQLDKMSEYADFPLAGIFRNAYLFRVPEAHIGALALSTVFDSSFQDATIRGTVAILDESAAALEDGSMVVRLTDPDGKSLPVTIGPLPIRVGAWLRSGIEISLPVAAPRKWDAEHPNLYTLALELRSGGRLIQTLRQRIGFRQTDIRESRLLINGRPVKIRGTCHHDSDPRLGRAVTPAQERQDVELMKQANLNALRTSHYPPLPELLDAADELGLYVEDEGSFCWVDVADDLRLTPRIMQIIAELLARDRNHPSVFTWSVCNESTFGYGFERAHEWLRAADPSRPDAGSYDRGSLEILAQHNPITIADIARLERQSKPVLWDECWCIFQGIFGDVGELWLDPGIRDYYAVPLPAIYARMMASPRIAGTQIWAWSDDIFCVPNRGLEYGRGATRSHFIEEQYRLPHRGLVGDAPWGVIDGWRRKKPEFWITKKLHSPVKLKEGPIPIPASGQPIQIAVENQYDFTDLSELNVAWQIENEKGLARSAIPPHTTGEWEIKPGHQPNPGEILALRFSDAKGRLVDAYRLPFGEARVEIPSRQTPVPMPLQISKETTLAGQGTRVSGHDFDLVFDQATGQLRRGVGFGEALLLEFPALHLLPSGAPLTPVPNRASWRLRDMTIEREGENVRVRLQGTYDQFEGGYDWLITPAGELTVHSSFRYTGDGLVAREIGWVLTVPKECDRLQWSRQAEWSVYQADDIGRPEGETRAFANHPATLPPTWNWSQDNSPMGCNDFRSTKRHIRWAALSYPTGPGVWVASDGSQSARATVESDRIALHVDDWYGGNHTGLWEWTSNYGEGKPVAKGETIESTIRLQIATRLPASRR
ncbi:MAG: glycoside hydrolase family 2 TIM barrel-domain containing protein [Limisphaerales bacterium]